MKCPRCEQENPPQAKFCLECGTPLGGALATDSSYAELQAENEGLRRSLGEASEQQTATAEILRRISSSPTDLQPVLDAMAERAARLCAAYDAIILRLDGDVLSRVAHHGPLAAPPALAFPATRDTVGGRTVLDRHPVHVADLQAQTEEFPVGSTVARQLGSRTVLGVPLLREGAAIGVIYLRRTQVQPFTDQQIALLQTFAEQAVIAIENVRLFKELQSSNRELSTALEQQTATAEILRVIASSPTDLQRVLAAVAESAAQLCEATDVLIHRVEGDTLPIAASAGSFAATYPVGEHFPIERGSVVGRAVLERRTIHVHDLAAESDDEFPVAKVFQRRYGHRTVLATPLMRKGVPLGAIWIRRTEIRPFSEKQITLLETFADQAVIAIENARLFRELAERNAALTEALDQQIATAEILQVISSSPTDVQPVLDAVALRATRLCGAPDALIMRVEGTMMRRVAHVGAMTSVSDVRPVTPGTPTGRAIVEGRTIHVEDIRDAFRRGEYLEARPLHEGTGFRTVLVVPLVREGVVIGAITIRRPEVRPFSEEQVALVQTFADQAVIAIENVRLFTEVREKNTALTQAHAQVFEALEQQTATADILRVISTSPMDLRPVLDAVVKGAARFCAAEDASIFRVDGPNLRLDAHHGSFPGSAIQVLIGLRIPIVRGTVGGRTVLERRAIHVADLQAEVEQFSEGSAIARQVGHRTILSVPLLREGTALGVIQLRRADVSPFTDKQIALLQTFADQAVIAIENVRLFTELQSRNRQLTDALEQQTATSEILELISSSPRDVQPVFDAIIANAVRLCGGVYGIIWRYDGDLVNLVGLHNVPRDRRDELVGQFPRRLDDLEGPLPAALRSGSIVEIPNVAAYDDAGRRMRKLWEARGVRSVVMVPMLQELAVVGAISVSHPEIGAFSSGRVELLKTFARQAVIAIDNVRLFRELESANRDLQTASQHKSEFLANMSHELRTPLNAIIGFSEVLADRMFGELNEKQDEYLKDIHASGQHLLSLINDILDLSKIEAGRMELELTDFDLPSALDNALTLVRERAGRHGIALHMSVDEGVERIRADERKIRQVVLNLLSNAIKFTPEGGRIDVRTVPGDGVIEVSVSDTGVGIAPEDQEAIFEEFRQVGTAAKKVEGTGLGLALSRKFIELHGGRIWVESQVGVGSTFTFTIPVRPDD